MFVTHGLVVGGEGVSPGLSLIDIDFNLLILLGPFHWVARQNQAMFVVLGNVVVDHTVRRLAVRHLRKTSLMLPCSGGRDIDFWQCRPGVGNPAQPAPRHQAR